MNNNHTERAASNRRLALKLAAVTVAMFGFGFALAPMYNLMCQAFGINGKVARVTAEGDAPPVATDRTVTVEFTGLAISGLPWEFRPLVKKMEVYVGKTIEAEYLVRNLAQEEITGQAIPSVTPGVAAAHFGKIECFCFTQQTLKPGETRKMPVRFVVDAGLDKAVHTITLSYSFFNADKTSARKYGGETPVPHEGHALHMPPAMASGG
jgi:cytochrome c oxidase assembly protein subunit 11